MNHILISLTIGSMALFTVILLSQGALYPAAVAAVLSAMVACGFDEV